MPGIANVHNAIVASVGVRQLVDRRECREGGGPGRMDHALQRFLKSCSELQELILLEGLKVTQSVSLGN